MREITCYVHDDLRYVTEYLVTIGTKAGYSKPTVRDMDTLVEKLESKLHKSEKSLRRAANSSPFDLDLDIDERGHVRRTEISETLQEQADQYDADSVRHLRV